MNPCNPLEYESLAQYWDAMRACGLNVRRVFVPNEGKPRLILSTTRYLSPSSSSIARENGYGWEAKEIAQ